MRVICRQIQQERTRYSDADYREHTEGSGAYLPTEQTESASSESSALVVWRSGVLGINYLQALHRARRHSRDIRSPLCDCSPSFTQPWLVENTHL